ncbi:MAG: hypothetical protein KF767_16160 [Bdellovibrionaceae bacterium]|nr:hypothetical protein [Pseudobdellovibrionaceae bacterium]
MSGFSTTQVISPITSSIFSRSLGLLLLLATAGPVQAEEFSAAGFEKVVIVAPAGQVVIGAGAQPLIRTSSVPQISWSAREEGKTLRLTATTSLGAPRTGAMPKIEILGGAYALDLHVTEGQVQASKWTRPVLIDLQKGKVTAKENRAGLSVQVGQGQIVVSDHAGPLRLDLFKGDINVSALQGNLHLSGHQSDVKLDKVTGSLHVQLYQGAVDLKGSGGSLQFQTGKASLNANGFKGRIEGEADEGGVTLGLVNETEAAVKTGSGRVTLDTKNSGSLLVLRSEEGDITGSRTLRAGKDRGAQVLRGRVKGGDGGRVEVVATRGNIVVRE